MNKHILVLVDPKVQKIQEQFFIYFIMDYGMKLI